MPLTDKAKEASIFVVHDAFFPCTVTSFGWKLEECSSQLSASCQWTIQVLTGLASCKA